MTIDWNTIIVALIGSIPAAIIAWRTHISTNSRMDEMIKVVRKESAAEATLTEKTAQKEREAQQAKGAQAVGTRDTDKSP